MEARYEFFFQNGRTEIFTLRFKEPLLDIESFTIKTNEQWTLLGFKKCALCSLKEEDHQYCPVARNLSYVLMHFKDDISYEQVTVKVTFNERKIEKHTTLEEGVSPLMGLIMATSGCPILDRFKPMAFIHQPFSNETETIFRAVSIYFIAQYIREKNNFEPDWQLTHFTEMYSHVNQVNKDFSERLRAIKGKDANINALLLLDLFAQVGTFSFSENWMKQIEPLFHAYL